MLVLLKKTKQMFNFSHGCYHNLQEVDQSELHMNYN